MFHKKTRGENDSRAKQRQAGITGQRLSKSYHILYSYFPMAERQSGWRQSLILRRFHKQNTKWERLLDTTTTGWNFSGYYQSYKSTAEIRDDDERRVHDPCRRFEDHPQQLGHDQPTQFTSTRISGVFRRLCDVSMAMVDILNHAVPSLRIPGESWTPDDNATGFLFSVHASTAPDWGKPVHKRLRFNSQLLSISPRGLCTLEETYSRSCGERPHYT